VSGFEKTRKETDHKIGLTNHLSEKKIRAYTRKKKTWKRTHKRVGQKSIPTVRSGQKGKGGVDCCKPKQLELISAGQELTSKKKGSQAAVAGKKEDG